MAIINLKTNLKSVINTSPTQPYIVKGIKESDSKANIATGLLNKISFRKDDVVRIGKFFTDTKNSAGFIAKSISLRRMNPLTESGEKLRTWTPLNIMSQVSTNIIGGNVNSFGLNPFDSRVGYSFRPTEFLEENSGKTNSRLLLLSQRLFTGNDDIISSYNGGSGSIFGIGRTIIKRAIDTDKFGVMSDKIKASLKSNITIQTSLDKTRIEEDFMGKIHQNIMIDKRDTVYSKFGKDYLRYDVAKPNTVSRNSSDETVDYIERLNIEKTNVPLDFRAKLSNLINPVTGNPFVEGYKKFNLENRVGLGNSDSTIGQLPVYYSDSPLGNSPKTKIFDKRIDSDNVIRPSSDYLFDQTRDLIRFRIELIDADNPNFGEYIILRSTIKGLTKTYSASWNPVNYVGRGETFKTYSSSEESIGFNFTIYAKSKSEMKVMYQKLNTLISGAIYPSYSKQNKMRGSMVRITVGDLIENQPAIITGFTLTVPDDNTWEIAVDTQNGSDRGLSQDDYVLPMILEGSISLTPIYNFLPQKSLSNSFFVLPNENIKTSPHLSWVGSEKGDMRILEKEIIKNTTAPSQTYISKFNELNNNQKKVYDRINIKSMQNADEYRTFLS